jgi:uncharacterized membrane protein YhaH (DUF805 family)
MVSKSLFLGLSGVFFLVFFINVVLGALAMPKFLADSGEVLVLLGAVVAFVVCVLKAETQSELDKSKESVCD